MQKMKFFNCLKMGPQIQTYLEEIFTLHMQKPVQNWYIRKNNQPFKDMILVNNFSTKSPSSVSANAIFVDRVVKKFREIND